ncbi:hypothetical protein A9X00_18280 [Mycobacterium sp. 1245805.9]|nr:hypothetical protein A9X00_18280 [Mycobacterium sp. 1245805.9]
MGGRREADVADTACGGGELTGNLGICGVELLGTQPDVSGERFGLSLARGAFCQAGTAGVGDRQVFSDSESRVLCVFDSVQDSPLRGADVTGPATGYSGGLP